MKWLELKIFPPVQFLLFAGAMWWVAGQCPFADFALPFRKLLAIFLFLLGGALGGTGVLAFLRRRTTIHPHRPGHASALVTTGLYRFSRNPMYLGLLLMLTGWALLLANGIAVVFLPAFVAVMNRLQIIPEERILRDKFCGEYDIYARTVRRWL